MNDPPRDHSILGIAIFGLVTGAVTGANDWLYFIVWDRWMDSNHREKKGRFDRVTAAHTPPRFIPTVEVVA